MAFNREALPEPQAYFGAEGLSFQERRGRWRTTACPFHGGSDSLRVNTQTGAWCCMACNAHGGDVLAFHMALHGLDFIEAARALGAWTEDGRPKHQRRPKAFAAHEALQVIDREANFLAITVASLARDYPIPEAVKKKLLQAAAAINHARTATQ